MINTTPLLIYFVAVLIIVASMLALSFFLGQRHQSRQTAQPYESGIRSFGSAHLRISVKYYLIALFFVIFDLESVFIFAWAVAAKDVGWAGYIEICIFIGILLAALVYLWKKGALDWGPVRSHNRPRVS